MQRNRTGWMQMMVLVAAGASCGPPPPVLHGTFDFARACTNAAGGSCGSATRRLDGEDGSTQSTLDGTLYAKCQVSTGSDGKVSVRFAIGTSVSGDPRQGLGVSVCGLLPNASPAAAGTRLANGSITVYLNGPAATDNLDATSGACTVEILSLGGDRFSGRLKCANLMDDNSPPGNNTIQGAGGTSGDSTYGQFTFTTCSTAPVGACPRLSGT